MVQNGGRMVAEWGRMGQNSAEWCGRWLRAAHPRGFRGGEDCTLRKGRRVLMYARINGQIPLPLLPQPCPLPPVPLVSPSSRAPPPWRPAPPPDRT
eukprot:8233993-Pyramimonas_sp.AAC.1